jgi:L-amino acid N-acyltransferase YncA
VTQVSIRLADPDTDAEAVAAIYASAIGTPASFEERAPDAAAMAARMAGILERTPWLVAAGQDGTVLGYAYAGAHHERAGYRWSVNISAYVAPDHRGAGVGRRLYDALIPLLRRQRFVNVYAGIALPNPASVGLHEALGFTRIGVYERAGYKLGRWHDVGWWQLALQPHSESPGDPLALSAVMTSPDWERLMTRGEELIRERIA